MASEPADDSQQPGCSEVALNLNGNGTHRDRLRNCCALVTYLPEPLRQFLDDLRLELVPGCKPHAHVTVLPPRPITIGCVDSAAVEAQQRSVEFSPFEIEIGDVATFPKTNVVYLEIGRGSQVLHAMHDAMNAGSLAYEEPFEFHPHITLAQDLTLEQSIERAELARGRWSEFRHSRRFHAETLTFVQNIGNNCWVDLAECPLAAAVPVLRR